MTTPPAETCVMCKMLEIVILNIFLEFNAVKRKIKTIAFILQIWWNKLN